MIITSQKPLEDILDFIKNKKKVFLLGCKLCATTCGTGGEPELKDMEKKLAAAGKTVTGWAILDPACSLLEIKRFYRKHAREMDDSEAILSFACGGGTQAAAQVLGDKDVYPGNNTLFQGEITEFSPRRAKFEQKCSLCGDCALAITGGLCPVTLCPKGLVNGPCGGVKNKKCEVDAQLDCVWVLIYERLKKQGRLSEMKKISEPKDHARNKKPQNLVKE